MEILLRRQLSIEKVKHDNSAIMFYTGFPSYEVLISFFFITLTLRFPKCNTRKQKFY